MQNSVFKAGFRTSNYSDPLEARTSDAISFSNSCAWSCLKPLHFSFRNTLFAHCRPRAF